MNKNISHVEPIDEMAILPFFVLEALRAKQGQLERIEKKHIIIGYTYVYTTTRQFKHSFQYQKKKTICRVNRNY